MKARTSTAPALREGGAGPRRPNDRPRAARGADDRRRLPCGAIFGSASRAAEEPPAPRTPRSGTFDAKNFGPDGFDASIDRSAATRANRTFVLFDGDELAGMSSFLGIDEARRCSKSAAPFTARTFAALASTAASRT